MEESRYFQWLVGERRGEVVVLDTIVQEDGDLFLAFKDNSRINENLVANINVTNVTGKMMAEVENTSKLWQFKEEIINTDDSGTYQDWESQVKYDIPSTTEIASDGQKLPPKKKKVKLIPPLRTRPEIVASKFGTIINAPAPPPPPSPEPATPSVAPKKTYDGDPVYIMLDKTKKVDTEVNMTLTISLPSRHLFDVVRDSFEDGANKGLEYIIENIDISDIKTALREGIEEMYGPNEDPNDHKIEVLSDKRKMEMPLVSPDMTKLDGTGIWQPEVIKEPEIREATPEEIKKLGDGEQKRRVEVEEENNN